MKKLGKTKLALVWAAILVFGLPLAAWAGGHPLTSYQYDAGLGYSYFDVVVSLDWDPTTTERNGTLKTAFETFAKDVCMMTEGKSKIRKVYVFVDGDQMNNADIRFLDMGGRSNANPNGIFVPGARILTYTGFSSGAARTASYMGHTMAHEWGHYALGVFDEYRGSAASSTTAWVPLSGDSPKNTIMNSQGAYQWLSIASDYTAADGTFTGTTAQWRTYGNSAWETLVNDPDDDLTPSEYEALNPRTQWMEFDGLAVPTVLNKPSCGATDPFEIIYKDDNQGANTTVLIIDNSGSMSGTPLANAREAAKQFVDLTQVGDKVAVVKFESTASVVQAMLTIANQTDRETIKTAIDGINSAGLTNYSDALNVAEGVFTASSTANENRSAIFMSDGSPTAGVYPPSTAYYETNNIPIHCIGLGSYINPTYLQTMATDTGGEYIAAPSSADLADLYARLNRTVSGTGAAVASENGDLTTGETDTFSTNIDNTATQAIFRLSWSDQADALRLDVTMPNGTVLTPNAGSYPTGVTWAGGTTYDIYTIDNPAPGDYDADIIGTTVGGTGEYSYEVSVESTLTVDIQTIGGEFPEPIGILATVGTPEPVIGADVMAVFTAPDESEYSVDLRDDGVSPDTMADDGVYAGVFTEYDQDGDYQVRVLVDGQTAEVDTGSALEAGDNASSRALDPFQRTADSSLTTSGVASYVAGTDVFSAVEVTPDNAKTWGAVLVDNQTLWYKVALEAGTQYYLQTSNLLATSAETMATTMTLYQPDGTTAIETSSAYQNTNVSHIAYEAETTDTYYITVAHASPGTGIFALTVGETSVFRAPAGDDGGDDDDDDDNPPVDGGGGGGGGGGCFIQTLY